MARTFDPVQLGSIELFCKAAELGSFTGAAESLGLTPASVSRPSAAWKRAWGLLATRTEIAEKDFNLNFPRYVDTLEEAVGIDLVAVRKERELLKAELAGLEAEIAAHLKDLCDE